MNWLKRTVRSAFRWGPWPVALWIVGTELIPTSYWFEVKSIVVSDTVAGVPPAIVIDRTISHPFFAWWAVSVRKTVKHDGKLMYEQVCYAAGSGDYKPTARIPADANLDWWTRPIKCDLKPGQYVLSTRWEMDVLGFRNRAVTVDSNPFYVLDP